MSDLKNYQEKWYDKVLVGALIISYIMMVIFTIVGKQSYIMFFSTLTSFLTGSLIMICLPRMGGFALPSLLLGLGIYMWTIGDLIDFIAEFLLKIPRPDAIIDTIYLFPNYFFGISVAVYFIQKLKGRPLYQFLVNVFAFTVIGIVLLRESLLITNSYQSLTRLELSRVYLYFFVNFFIIIMIFHMVYMIAAESGLKGTNTMIIGIFVYISLDFPYNYLAITGADPENKWLNLIYMICMMLMAHGIFHQIRHKHVFRLKEHQYNEKTMKRTRIWVLLGIVLSIILALTVFHEKTDLFYLLLALLGYWVMTASFQNSALTEQLIKQQDLLTGLYNRRYSPKVLSECVKDSQDKDATFCIYCIDLNHFKPINDTYGHDMGDKVLKEFGKRLLELPSDYVSFRTGGDEFMVIRNRISDQAEVMDGANILLELFSTPMELDTYVFRLSGSIGGAIYRTHTLDTDELVRYADAAMYVVKHSGRKNDFKLFDRDLIQTVENHKTLENILKTAEPSRDFVLLYQPQIDNRSGEVVGAEVYPRLNGEGNGIYSAHDIIPVAEETGLIRSLGKWIAEESIRCLSVWQKETGKDLSLRINLAPLQLLDKDFMERLKDLTGEYSVKPGTVRLDISNEVMMGAAGSAKTALRDLKDFGFMIALNDFGGGNINLSHILECGFSEIDISRSLIVRSESDSDARKLIGSIVAIADSLGISASAVGIENEKQVEFISKMNIYTLQGYYYGRPVPEDEFRAKYISPNYP